VYSKDAIIIDAEAGTVEHKYSPVGDRGALVGAWAIVYRNGRRTPVEYVHLGEYKSSDGQWGQRPATMIVKCARAAALRRAYPNAFSGIYEREEFEEETQQAAPATPPAASRTLSVLERVKSQIAPGVVTQQPVERIEVGPPVPTPPPANTTPSGTTTAAPVEPTVEFGAKKGLPQGKRIVDLTGPELEQCIAEYEKHLADPRTKGTPTASKMFLNLDALKSELAQRMAAAEDAPF
jgi:hypothetical protein